MQLSQILFSQGFGTRRDCEALVLAGLVAHAGTRLADPRAEFDPDGLRRFIEEATT